MMESAVGFVIFLAAVMLIFGGHDAGTNLYVPFFIIWANVAVFVVLFIIAYVKKSARVIAVFSVNSPRISLKNFKIANLFFI